MRFAAIDIGTNTVRLLIADVETTRLKTVTREMFLPRLGARIGADKNLTEDAMKRTTNVLELYKQRLTENEVDKAEVIATSAVRDAENASSFTELVKTRTGFDIKILSGKEEARRSFLGATTGLSLVSGKKAVLVADVGGGSTELSFGYTGKLEYSASIDIGSVRLTTRFIKKDPPSNSEIDDIRAYVVGEMKHTVGAIKRCVGDADLKMLGVAGTFTTLVSVRDAMKIYDPDKVHLTEMTLEQVDQVLEQFRSVDLERRCEIVGLEPQRADVIIAGTVICLETMRSFGLDHVTVSEHDILEGTIWTIAGIGDSIIAETD